MSFEIEQEQTYLLDKTPEDINEWKSEFLADTYLPKDSGNPQIRLRQRGDSYFITKKYPKNPSDLSTMIEETINLSKEEYDFFRKSLPGKYLAKIRYKREDDGIIIEIDAYQDALSPLLVMDLEWTNSKPSEYLLSQFKIKKDITQIHELAGGQLAGKSYEDIEPYINN